MDKKIFIYLKESPLKLLYLGKTINDPFKYNGSGKYWKRHLKANKFLNKDIKTIILCCSYDKEEIRNAGLYYSNLWNVVLNENFANLVEESGDGSFGWKHTPENIEIIRKSGKGRKMTEINKKMLIELNTGRIVSEETKKKISIKNKNRVVSDEIRKKMSDAQKGKKMPPSFGEAISKAKKGKPISENTIKGAIAYHTGRKQSQETIEKRRSKMKGIVWTEEQLKNRLDKVCRKVIHKETGIIYSSIGEAVKFSNMTYSCLSAQLRRKSKKCKFEYFSDLEKRETYGNNQT